jgi:sugar O-acyltransferase (sialic acid O-acetyltransferase NeuD family)
MEAAGLDQRLAQDSPVVVIGAGGHAGVLLHTLSLLGRRVLFATEADADRYGHEVGGVEIRGGDDSVFHHPPGEIELVNGIGSTRVPHRRQTVFERFREAGYRFASVVHPSAVIAPTASLGQGVQVMAGAVVQHNARIGDNVLLNTRASVDHDCVIGEHVHVAPGVIVCGSVLIGAATHVGAGATIIQGLHIGDRVLIGAGSVVVSPVPSDSQVLGVPARPRLAPAGLGEGP